MRVLFWKKAARDFDGLKVQLFAAEDPDRDGSFDRERKEDLLRELLKNHHDHPEIPATVREFIEYIRHNNPILAARAVIIAMVHAEAEDDIGDVIAEAWPGVFESLQTADPEMAISHANELYQIMPVARTWPFEKGHCHQHCHCRCYTNCR